MLGGLLHEKINILGGQYSEEVYNDLKNLISETEALIKIIFLQVMKLI